MCGIASRVPRSSHLQLGKSLLPSCHGHFAEIGGRDARFPFKKTVKMLFGAETEAEGDLRELQARECQIALGSLHASFLDEIVVGQTAVVAENDLKLVLIDSKAAQTSSMRQGYMRSP